VLLIFKVGSLIRVARIGLPIPPMTGRAQNRRTQGTNA
jgi:hypothetical protein